MLARLQKELFGLSLPYVPYANVALAQFLCSCVELIFAAVFAARVCGWRHSVLCAGLVRYVYNLVRGLFSIAVTRFAMYLLIAFAQADAAMDHELPHRDTQYSKGPFPAWLVFRAAPHLQRYAFHGANHSGSVTSHR